jgi:P4 family phage/plasmid primase-like protien
MTVLSEEEQNVLNAKYGNPIFSKNEKFAGLNQQYFAAYIAKTYDVIYYLPESKFYMYNEDAGIWQIVSDEKMLNVIGCAIHKFAVEYNQPEIENCRTTSMLAALLKLLKGQTENKDAFTKRLKRFVHCANTIIEYNEITGNWEEKEFSPRYYSRNQNPITYNPQSRCSQFLDRLLGTAMTEDDIEHLQMYLGQCLLGVNLSQTFLLLIGTAGGGKSTLVNVIEGIVGRWNCTELRLEHMAGRFELSRTSGKNLLTAKDVNSSFMSSSGAGKLKALTGNDAMTIELKSSNTSFDVQGSFNVIITSNAILRIEIDGDIEAWRRRMLLINYEKPATGNVIVNFDKRLLEEEGSGILNWALEGAMKLLKAGGKISKSPEQQAKVNILLQSSRPFDVFADNFIHPTLDASITTEEVVSIFTKFCNKLGWALLPERKIQKLFHEWMRTRHTAVLRTDIKRNGRNKRGYSGFQIRDKNNMGDNRM